MTDTELNKSEDATPYKLSKARDKGQVARGVDLGFAASLAALAGFAWIGNGLIEHQLSLASREAFVFAPQLAADPQAVMTAAGRLLGRVMGPLLMLAGALFATVLLFELVQSGVVFSTDPLRPDLNRLNPGQNFKKLFTPRVLVETAKNVLKLVVYTAIVILVIRSFVQTEAPQLQDAGELAAALGRTAQRLLLFMVLAAIAFAIIDQLIVRREFGRRMRMSRQEVRREVRDREGEPRLKQRRKQLHRDLTKLSQSLRGIRAADVLITNPVHFAVALKYDAASMTAPTVVSQGAHQIAQRLKRLAFVYGVIVVEDRELARLLYQRCRLGQEVPELVYQRVADIYLDIGRRKGRTMPAAASGGGQGV